VGISRKKYRAALGDLVAEPKRNPNASGCGPRIQRIASLFATLHLVGYTPTLCATVRHILVRSQRFYAESCILTSEKTSFPDTSVNKVPVNAPSPAGWHHAHGADPL
jgi:hypothetical protein